MEITISGIFNTPNIHFDLSSKFLYLISDTLKEKILDEYLSKKLKAKEISIYILTDGSERPSYSQMISKSDKNKYLVFHFNICYTKVVNSVNENLYIEMNLVNFVKEFMICFNQSFKNYITNENIFMQAENEILHLLNLNLESYMMPYTENDAKLRLLIRQKLKELRN